MGLKAAESGHQGVEVDSGRERERATAKSKIKVGLDQCHYCKITSESVRERERERDTERVGCLYKSVVGNIMPQSYPLPAYYLAGLLVHHTSIKHFDSKSNHSFL